MKRIFDIAFALLLLLPALLLCIPALIVIRIESPGAPLFLQTRVGKDRKPFKLLKLRTMVTGTMNKGSHEISSAQITRTGHILRRTKVDELPQIWNVLTGSMSFVGPRPCLPNQTQLIAERQARGVYNILPGITGPAQIAGIDMSNPEKLAIADAAYMKSRTFIGELRLILQTAVGGGRGDAVKGS